MAWAVVSLAAANVRADPATERARTLFNQAEVHFNVQEFEEALALYGQAYKLKPLPGFLFNMGQCQRHLGRFDDALFSYRMYLDKRPDAPNRAEVEALIVQIIEGRAARVDDESRQGPRLTPPAVASGSDGRGAVGQAPADDRTSPPETAESSRDSSSEPQQAGAAGSDLAVNASPVTQDSSLFERVSPWTWASAGAVVALLGTGVITGQMAANKSATYREADTSIADRRDLRDEGRRLAGVSATTLTLAGVGAVATGVWAYFQLRQESARAQAGLAPAGDVSIGLLPGGATITMGATF